MIPDDAVRYSSASAAIQACDEWESPIHSIRHVVRDGDKFVIMGHINCEHCPRCGVDPSVEGTRHHITMEPPASSDKSAASPAAHSDSDESPPESASSQDQTQLQHLSP